MAGDLSLVPAENFEKPLSSIKNKWQIEYSRFFNFPRSLSITSPNLRPLPKTRFRCGGKIIEEHFTCNLQFSWPQVSCVTQCPTRGSRVVFASYRDCDGKIQKFALRFATSCDAESFIAALKESLKDVMETGVPRSDFGSEISSQSEFVSSNGLQYRSELNLMDPVATYSPQMTSILNSSGRQNIYSQESLLDHSFGRICEADLPPSFTALLTNCSAEVQQEQVKVPEEDLDLKSQIMRYMSDSSFHDMLVKVEEVISEMGGDLAL